MNIVDNYADWTIINSMAVQQAGKPAVYLANGLGYHRDDIAKSRHVDANLKKLDGDYFTMAKQVIHGGLFFFDTNEQCAEFFNIFNAPLMINSELYACIYNSDGKKLMDNQT